MKHQYKNMKLLRSGDYLVPVDSGYGVLIEGDDDFVALVLTQENLRALRAALDPSTCDIAVQIEQVANAYMADRGIEQLNTDTCQRNISDNGENLAYQKSPKSE